MGCWYGMLVVASKERMQRIFMGLVCFGTSLCGQWVPVDPPMSWSRCPCAVWGSHVACTPYKHSVQALLRTEHLHPPAPGVQQASSVGPLSLSAVVYALLPPDSVHYYP